MSYEAVQWALYDAPELLTSAGRPDAVARFVLVARAERADAKGRSTYAGTADVMKATGYDERTIERAERRLEDAGLLVRGGFSQHGTVLWHLDMSLKRAEGDRTVADARIERRREADAERMRRYRERKRATESIDDDGENKISVTDADAVTSRTENPNVTDAESERHVVCAPETTLRTTHRTSLGATPGGAPPPDPRRRPPPSASAFESAGSLAIAPTPAQDHEGESLPHARETAPVVELFPGVLGEAPYRTAVPQPPRRGQLPDVVAEAMERRAAARAQHQAHLAAQQSKEIS